jgi:hypothetical protein
MIHGFAISFSGHPSATPRGSDSAICDGASARAPARFV